MAVLDTVPGLEVSVRINNENLPEYDDDEDGEQSPVNTVCKYVESVSDAEYSIVFLFTKPFVFDSDSLSLSVEIDGQVMHQPVIEKKSHPPDLFGNRFLRPFQVISEGRGSAVPGRRDEIGLQKFKFTKIQTTTDDEHLKNISKDAKKIYGVGEIILKVFNSGPITTTFDSNSSPSKVLGPSTVHEEALKGQAKSHSTSLGPPIEKRPIRYVSCQKIGEPLAVFKLKYRSRESLKSLLIIERTPTPDPENAGTPAIDDLNPEQRRELDRFLKGLVNNRNGSSNPPDKTIKREREVIKEGGSRKKRRSGENITIDLTGDSDDDDLSFINIPT